MLQCNDNSAGQVEAFFFPTYIQDAKTELKTLNLSFMGKMSRKFAAFSIHSDPVLKHFAWIKQMQTFLIGFTSITQQCNLLYYTDMDLDTTIL